MQVTSYCIYRDFKLIVRAVAYFLGLLAICCSLKTSTVALKPPLC